MEGYKIRVNAISPGPIDTPMSSGADEQLMTSVITTVPMGRMGSPDEVAKAVSFSSIG
jgi:NAD(P)-dependent dehydrogenase (short-subunit alcohol dehydrogenase family)